MQVKLIAHTQLSETFKKEIGLIENVTDGQVVALTAIRTCYSYKRPTEIVPTEGEKYFGDRGKESKRLFKQIVSSGHTSTLEGLNFTFAIEGVSRALLAQLTRHRHMSFSVQSQRFVKFSSDSRSGGFDYVVPEKIIEGSKGDLDTWEPIDEFTKIMIRIQESYDKLIEMGIPQEDARAVLPNATACNLVLTANLRTLLEFYEKRKPGSGAQKEISQLAEELKNRIVEVEPWTEEFFE